MLVYKYVVPERIDILENGYLRFSQADALNDPFESYPRYDQFERGLKELRYAVKGYNPNDIIRRNPRVDKDAQDLRKWFRDKMKSNTLVFSLTKKRNNLVMWSHYTNAHRGFVIGFDSNNLFFRQKTSRNTGPLAEVEYADERVSVPFGKSVSDELVKVYRKVFFTKSIHWAYEEELRVLSQPSYGKIIGKDNNGLDIYVFDFPPECLKEIIFGYLSTTELKRRISEIVASRYPHVELFEAQPSETDFDLDIKSYRVP